GPPGIDPPYDVPNPSTQFHEVTSPLRQGSYRALAATFNNFSRETYMDELAHAAGIDPVEFRLRNLKNDRLRAVLQAAADRFGWGKNQPAPNHGFGIACGTEKGGFIATAVEVLVDPDASAPKVVRASSAFECGAILNPDHLLNQVNGAIIMGIGGALLEAIRFKDGKILNPHLAQYRVPRYADVPVLDTVLLDRKDLPSAGAGECPIIAVAPAIGNAIFSATGKRLRSMPLKLEQAV
ncbi:MAG TPA: molybdopterin cofactor-binding domain-containing protein, partial [Fimbriimonas sp.]|nr:molybdopterin cofactor-binding domain-containing protein [Fimbriimonas sp.]